MKYSLSGNVNNLHQSLQNIVKQPELLEIVDNAINAEMTFDDSNKNFVFRVDVPIFIQVESLVVNYEPVEQSVYFIVQRDTDVVQLNDFTVINSNYLETNVNLSSETSKELLRSGKELKGGSDEATTSYVLIFYVNEVLNSSLSISIDGI